MRSTIGRPPDQGRPSRSLGPAQAESDRRDCRTPPSIRGMITKVQPPRRVEESKRSSRPPRRNSAQAQRNETTMPFNLIDLRPERGRKQRARSASVAAPVAATARPPAAAPRARSRARAAAFAAASKAVSCRSRSACRTSAASPTSSDPVGSREPRHARGARRRPATITPEALFERGVIRGLEFPVKILGSGELPAQAVSSARTRFPRAPKQQIEAAGGTVTVLERTDRWITARPRSRRLPHQPRAQGSPLRQGRRSAASRRGRQLRRADRGPSMLEAVINAFKIPDLRRKILFTLGDAGDLPHHRQHSGAGRRSQTSCRTSSRATSSSAC